jgi:uncharacterized membrane protein HdeD (DUF308 family)
MRVFALLMGGFLVLIALMTIFLPFTCIGVWASVVQGPAFRLVGLVLIGLSVPFYYAGQSLRHGWLFVLVGIACLSVGLLIFVMPTRMANSLDLAFFHRSNVHRLVLAYIGAVIRLAVGILFLLAGFPERVIGSGPLGALEEKEEKEEKEEEKGE